MAFGKVSVSSANTIRDGVYTGDEIDKGNTVRAMAQGANTISDFLGGGASFIDDLASVGWVQTQQNRQAIRNVGFANPTYPQRIKNKVI